MTFIGLQVLGSISFLSGNESSVETDLKTIENKNVGTKNQDIDNHVNLKKLKNDQSNVANKDGSIIENSKDDTKQKLSKLESKSSNSVNIYKEHPEAQLLPVDQGKKSEIVIVWNNILSIDTHN